ncbi:MAG TPA: PadR family transcriptional regulator [Steroidobacteraceae bacterium]|jgi:DNA-binding PadR family transcriptional regulator|nr:PadR family transcriptional regulator [Steroidobacteraceae bacterium]
MHRHFHNHDRHEHFQDDHAHFMGRRHGHRGFGHFSGGFMDGMGMGGRAFRAGRRLASGDLQLVLLALLAERASHGYELIKALEERSDGFYSPSPGMVYPALTWLEEMGYASVTAEGVKKLYSITDAGRAYLVENQDAADAMLSQLEHVGRKMGRLREALGGIEEDEDTDWRELATVRRELKRALREKRRSSPEEKGRVIAILMQALEQIRGGR